MTPKNDAAVPAAQDERLRFEAFFATRSSKGLKAREHRMQRLADGSYADESVQRHWWTWQNATPQASAKPAEVAALSDALNAFMTYFGMDEDEWSKPVFDKARRALASTPSTAAGKAPPSV